ncbi:MAG TPA: hypothetical protein VG737_04285, partial [Cyclobacteriaceae bacterium]|nr:hypothetical protein [Cyclobacteriaceae bacterium]
MRHIISLLLITTILGACQRGKQQSDDRQSLNFETARSNFFNNLVKPSVVAHELQAAAPEFHPELLSDPR